MIPLAAACRAWFHSGKHKPVTLTEELALVIFACKRARHPRSKCIQVDLSNMCVRREFGCSYLTVKCGLYHVGILFHRLDDLLALLGKAQCSQGTAGSHIL